MPFSSLSSLVESRIKVVGGFEELHQLSKGHYTKVAKDEIDTDKHHIKTTPSETEEQEILRNVYAFVLRTSEPSVPVLAGRVTFPITVGVHPPGIEPSWYFYAVVPRDAYELVMGKEPQATAPNISRKPTLVSRKSTLGLKEDEDKRNKSDTLIFARRPAAGSMLIPFVEDRMADGPPQQRNTNFLETVDNIPETIEEASAEEQQSEHKDGKSDRCCLVM